MAVTLESSPRSAGASVYITAFSIGKNSNVFAGARRVQ